MATRWIEMVLDDSDINLCMQYGQLMRDGNVKLSNVKHLDVDSFENYTDGKIGELAFWRWLTESGIEIIHHPFRQDYSVLDPDDDFIIVLNGRHVKIEVRIKTRSVPPSGNWDQCSETIKTDRIYVFTERQRPAGVQRPRPSEVLTVNHFRGTVNMVGWVTPERFAEHGRFQPKGTLMTSGNKTWPTRRDEYQIYVRDLEDMITLPSY